MPAEIKLESLTVDPPVEILQSSQGAIMIGREPENNVVVDSASVSRRHAGILDARNHWVFKDFESSNGSWVNGVKLSPGQIRLLRHGDIVRVADFAMRVSEVNPRSAEQLAAAGPSVLVFYKDAFDSEVQLNVPNAGFQIGGEGGNFFIEGASPDAVFLSINPSGKRLELHTGQMPEQIIVNGLAVSGVTALSDRDEISLPPYRLVVNDIKSDTPHSAKAVQTGRGSGIQAYDRPNLPAHLQSQSETEEDGWVSEASRRKESTGKRFVFGSEPEDPMNKTMTLGQMPPQQSSSGGRPAYEMSSSHRFANVYSDNARQPRAMNETLLVALGVIIFLLLIVFVVYLVVSLT